MKPIPTLTSSSIQHFRKHAFEAALPRLLPRGTFAPLLPAICNWFHHNHDPVTLNTSYLRSQPNFSVPVEITSTSNNVQSFERVDLPFSHFIAAITSPKDSPNHQLYIAQAPLPSIPATLQSDVPTPALVLETGKGDLYDSSLWLGLAPTYTPLHRDPNPNLFVQLAGRKRVRIFPPDFGRALFSEAQRQVGGQSDARFRGEEMMVGVERKVLRRMVWDDDDKGGDRVDEPQANWESNGEGDVERAVNEAGVEAELDSGDGLFIPTAWWHSIRGVRKGVNGSVNFWFR